MSMAATRKAHTLPGSDKWFGEELTDFGTEINDMMEDYAYEIRNQIDWINNYVSDITCSNKTFQQVITSPEKPLTTMSPRKERIKAMVFQDTFKDDLDSDTLFKTPFMFDIDSSPIMKMSPPISSARPVSPTPTRPRKSKSNMPQTTRLDQKPGARVPEIQDFESSPEPRVRDTIRPSLDNEGVSKKTVLSPSLLPKTSLAKPSSARGSEKLDRAFEEELSLLTISGDKRDEMLGLKTPLGNKEDEFSFESPGYEFPQKTGELSGKDELEKAEVKESWDDKSDENGEVQDEKPPVLQPETKLEVSNEQVGAPVVRTNSTDSTNSIQGHEILHVPKVSASPASTLRSPSKGHARTASKGSLFSKHMHRPAQHPEPVSPTAASFFSVVGAFKKAKKMFFHENEQHAAHKDFTRSTKYNPYPDDAAHVSRSASQASAKSQIRTHVGSPIRNVSQNRASPVKQMNVPENRASPVKQMNIPENRASPVKQMNVPENRASPTKQMNVPENRASPVKHMNAPENRSASPTKPVNNVSRLLAPTFSSSVKTVAAPKPGGRASPVKHAPPSPASPTKHIPASPPKQARPQPPPHTVGIGAATVMATAMATPGQGSPSRAGAQSQNTIRAQSQNTVRTQSQNTIRTQSQNTIRTNSQNTVRTNSQNTVRTNSQNSVRLGTQSQNTIRTNSQNTIRTQSQHAIRPSTQSTHPVSVQEEHARNEEALETTGRLADMVQSKLVLGGRASLAKSAVLHQAKAFSPAVAAAAPPKTVPPPDLPEIYSESEDDDEGSVIMEWANSPQLHAQLLRQQQIDPDTIFGPIAPLQLEDVFKSAKDAKKFRPRSSSANWSGQDKLSQAEVDRYAREMGYK